MVDSLRIGIAGLGTVGVGVLQILRKHEKKLSSRIGRKIEVGGICARDKSRDRGVDISGFRWYDDALALAQSPDIDLFVELIGGEDGIAKSSIMTAMDAGKHVVTANKALLAHHGTELAKLAEAKQVALNFEAAVAGGTPTIKTMREGIIGNDVSRVFGIFNGTCNYILTKMQEEQRDFADVLAEAQGNGYAEADPTFDIGGFDTAHKLAIVTSLAFGTEVSFEDIYIEGIENITPEDILAADEMGYRIKLLGVGLKTDTGIEQRVHPAMVSKHSPIAGVEGVINCVAIDCDFLGEMMLVGPGAGGGPTASAVVNDIADIARGCILPPFLTKAKDLAPYQRARMRAHEGGYYIRLNVKDHPGAVASIAGRMAECDISINSMVQNRTKATDAEIPVFIITHKTTEKDVRQAIENISKDGHVSDRPQVIRIENL
jgi:homoserine dehydrogenase